MRRIEKIKAFAVQGSWIRAIARGFSAMNVTQRRGAGNDEKRDRETYQNQL